VPAISHRNLGFFKRQIEGNLIGFPSHKLCRIHAPFENWNVENGTGNAQENEGGTNPKKCPLGEEKFENSLFSFIFLF
jgi:hypothetical protein